MRTERNVVDRVAPRQQINWDIRGALNFIFGGQGAGLLVAAACVISFHQTDLRPLVTIGLALIGAGLFCVWLKIGRPWRALYVFRRPTTSWMSREALIAPVIFSFGAASVFLDSKAATIALGPLGFAYIYAQAQILKANIGIPAWRSWFCVAMIIATALVEGFGILLLVAPILPSLVSFAWAFIVLVVVRYIVWQLYRRNLRKTGAPIGTLSSFDDFDSRFTLVGHVGAVLLSVAGAWSYQPLLVALGGGCALLVGALFKYVLICRAAFSQGFALPKMPSRGNSPPRNGVRPGWQQRTGS